jgi:co-chaperonin GroES (HSP10)
MKKVLKDRVLITPIDPNISESGLTLTATPGAPKDKAERGIVFAIGKEVTEVEVGDKIFFNRMNTKPYSEGKEEYLLLREDDIYLII